MSTLWKNYSPVIVLVPAIVGIHYGWFLLQQNEKLVPKDQQVTEQPIISVIIKSTSSLLTSAKKKYHFFYNIYILSFPFRQQNSFMSELKTTEEAKNNLEYFNSTKLASII